jgi:hypothetical protein
MPTGISIMPARTLKPREQQEVHVGLFELQLALLLAALDERVLDFDSLTKRMRR